MMWRAPFQWRPYRATAQNGAPGHALPSVAPLRPALPRAVLVRDDVRATCIRGTLMVKDQVFQILERPWLDNRVNVSCIPAGTYAASFLPRSGSGKYRNVFHLDPVPGRSGILIHNGNIVDHSRGCLIIGLRRGTVAGKPAVLNSRTALYEFGSLLAGKAFQLIIKGDQICSAES